MAYPNYGYNNYGYVPNYAPGYVQPQYATNPYQNMQPVQTQAVPNTVIPPTTNKRLCISQEDAMSRQVENNSSYVYFDQNKDIMYEVNTDAWGKKTCNVYSLAVYKNPEVAEVPKESFEDLSKRISQLEDKIKSMEVNTNAQYDGQRNADAGKPANAANNESSAASQNKPARFEDEDEKYLMEMQDGRRGVKGTGRGRRRGRRRDYGETLSLTKSDIMNWKHNLENADGTRGPHFNMEQVMEAAKAVGIRFEDFDERELCMTVNMLYSDYCEVNKPYVSPERECHYYVELAKAFLEDDDGPEPSEKLALYYYCIAEDE